MRVLLLPILILALATGLCAQAGQGGGGFALIYASSVWVNPSTGETNGNAYSEISVGDNLPVASMSASAYIDMYDSSGYINTTGFEADNVGEGYASVNVYGQVYVLGDYVAESSSHGGSADAYEIQWSDQEYSSDYFQVPSSPTIQLTGIDASSPHSVAWSYYVTGPQPYNMNFQLGDVNSINTGYPWGTFYVDQMNYPGGYNIAYITGHMYGVTVNGPTCPVQRTDNYSATDSTTVSRLDGTSNNYWFGYISVKHIIADTITNFQYECSLAPNVYTALVSTLARATGSLDTSNNNAAANRNIAWASETHNHGGFVDQLNPQYSWGSTFQSWVLDYPLGTWWFPAGYQGNAICNTALTVSGYTTNNPDFYATGPLGCLTVPMP